MYNNRGTQDATVYGTPNSGNGDFEPASSGVLQEIWALDHGWMVQKSLGESRYVWDNSGSLQYPSNPTKKKKQVIGYGIEAQRALDRRSTPT